MTQTHSGARYRDIVLKRVVGIDIKAEGQRTTLGRAQFALFNANMLNLTKEIKGAPGRRKTVSSSCTDSYIW